LQIGWVVFVFVTNVAAADEQEHSEVQQQQQQQQQQQEPQAEQKQPAPAPATLRGESNREPTLNILVPAAAISEPQLWPLAVDVRLTCL
jgi:hypothetical protein